MQADFSMFAGGDLVASGLEDLRNRVLSDEALLVLIAAPRLGSMGIDVPRLAGAVITGFPEHELFGRLSLREAKGAHSLYNALIGRIVSFVTSYGLWLKSTRSE